MNLASKIKAMIGKAALDLIQASGSYTILLLNGEKRECASPQQYGVKSRPPKGSKQVVLFPNGERDEGIVIVSHSEEGCPKLVAQEMAIFTLHGNSFHLKSDGTFHAIGDVKWIGDMEIQGDLEVTGNIEAGGNISADGDVSDGVSSMQQMREIYNAHTHIISSGSSAGSTAATTSAMG